MELRSGLRTIIAALVGIGIVVLLIVLLVKAFTGGGAPPNAPSLVSFANTSTVAQLYIDAPIVADQEHQAVKIIVGRDQTEIDVMQGYQNKVVASEVFGNNPTSYAVFLQALNRLNFTKGSTDPARQDERGYCDQGDRYIYTLNDGTRNLLRYWSTTCGQGTFGGRRDQVRLLFQRQIPLRNFVDLTKAIPLT